MLYIRNVFCYDILGLTLNIVTVQISCTIYYTNNINIIVSFS